jgi:competence protein ComEC
MGGRDGGGASEDGDGADGPARSAVAARPVVRPDNEEPNRAPRWHVPQSGVLRRAIAGFDIARQWLAQSYLQEIASGNHFAWYVVAFAVGAAIYLILPREPSFWALSGLLGVCCAVLLARRRTAGRVFGLTICVMVIAGVWAGALKSIRVAGPRLDHERVVTVTGWITEEEAVLNGATRMTVKVAEMIGRRLPKSAVPEMITVTFRASTPSFAVGTGLRFMARLQPLQGPVMPGGYDFARRAFFDGRGATGYALGKVGPVDLGPPDWVTRIIGAISELRHRMSQRIRAALPGAQGAIAAAIIVGEQRGIPDAENDALRMSGLPHMITIAGLHMSIVAGCVFIAMRWLLALIPSIALRFPIKKWAACGALAATTFYMLISGGHVSAERAYLMGAIMLLSVILGRPALTMRNLGLAAIILLVRNPTQVIEPGFLMSFLAVMSLIAAYQAWWAYRTSQPRAPDHEIRPIGYVLRSVAGHGIGIMASTLIATVATAGVTADQFFRVSPYSALSNVVVFPAIDMVAMPAAVVACLAMPFGLEVIPLTIMGWAIDYMDSIGFIAASLPGGQGLVGRIHPWSNALEIAGLCWMCLWHRSWRLLGALPIVAALVLAPFASRPDILISPDAMAVAVRGTDGQLKVLGANRNRFTVANWLTADAAPTAPADPRMPLDPHLGDGWACDTIGCIFTRPTSNGQDKQRIAVVTNAQGFDEDCSNADIVITRLVAPTYCAQTALVFDRDRLAATGAVALTFNRKPQPAREPGPDIDSATNQRVPPDMKIATSLPDRSRAWLANAIVDPPSQPKPAKAAQPPATATSRPETSDATDDSIDAAPLNAEDLLSRSAAAIVWPTRENTVKPRLLPLDPTNMPDLPDP